MENHRPTESCFAAFPRYSLAGKIDPGVLERGLWLERQTIQNTYGEGCRGSEGLGLLGIPETRVRRIESQYMDQKSVKAIQQQKS
jgi:hypothetical protein